MIKRWSRTFLSLVKRLDGKKNPREVREGLGDFRTKWRYNARSSYGVPLAAMGATILFSIDSAWSGIMPLSDARLGDIHIVLATILVCECALSGLKFAP